MSHVIDSRPSPLSATPIRVAIVASLVLHALLILRMPQFTRPPLDPEDQTPRDIPLTVRLAPPFLAPREPIVPPPPAPARRARPRPTPPVAVLDKPAPTTTPPVAAPTPPATAGDLLAYVESRRRARGDPAAAVDAPPASQIEDERQRANRIAAANLATQRQISFGYDPSRSGGVFTIERMSRDYAEFTFIGWNQDARRHTKQLIEVNKGNNPDIRVAVVREMIAIIRRYEPVEFAWDSRRLGRSVLLSSRPRDTAGLEDFMLKEFF